MANINCPLNFIIGSATIPTPRFSNPQIISCPAENDMASNLDAYLPNTITWNVQNNAPTNSSASPGLTSNLPPVDRRNAPTPAKNTATMDIQCGFSRQTISKAKGTNTTYKPVIKPALPAVVYTMPAC